MNKNKVYKTGKTRAEARKVTNKNNRDLVSVAIDMYKTGMTCVEIEEKLEVSDSTILRWVRKSDKTRNRSESQTGERNHRWLGGVSLFDIRHTLAYRIWRDQVFQRDNYTCKICDERGNKLNAHHLELFAKNEDLRFDINNGETLCYDCHKWAHSQLGYQG
jgi:hypothetical protein